MEILPENRKGGNSSQSFLQGEHYPNTKFKDIIRKEAHSLIFQINKKQNLLTKY